MTERGKEAWYTLSVSFADSSPKGRAKAPAGAGSNPHKFQFFAEPTGRGAQGQLYLVPNVRNVLAAGLARQIPIYLTAEDFGQQKISASCAPLEYRQGGSTGKHTNFFTEAFFVYSIQIHPEGIP